MEQAAIEYDGAGLTQNGKLAELIEARKIYGLPYHQSHYGQERVYEPVEVVLPDGPLVEVRSQRITVTPKGVNWPTIEYFNTLQDALIWAASKRTGSYDPGYCIVGHGKIYAMMGKLEVWRTKW